MGPSVGGLCERVQGTSGSVSEGASTTAGIGAGAAELVPSVLTFFTDLEVEAPFLLWVLRPWANLRAMPASMSAIKEDQHRLEME